MPPPAPVAQATAYRKLAPRQSPTVSVWICTRGWSQEEQSSAFVSSYASIDDVRVLENRRSVQLVHACHFQPWMDCLWFQCMLYMYNLLGTSVRYLWMQRVYHCDGH